MQFATNVPIFRKVLLTIIFGGARCAGARQKVLRNDCRKALLAAARKNLPGGPAQSSYFQKRKGGESVSSRPPSAF
jgi:hypothetical protein